MKFQIDHDLHIHSRLSRCSRDREQTPARILRYAEENGYTITGPARGILLASVCEEDKLNGYFEVWIPIA